MEILKTGASWSSFLSCMSSETGLQNCLNGSPWKVFPVLNMKWDIPGGYVELDYRSVVGNYSATEGVNVSVIDIDFRLCSVHPLVHESSIFITSTGESGIRSDLLRPQ